MKAIADAGHSVDVIAQDSHGFYLLTKEKEPELLVASSVWRRTGSFGFYHDLFVATLRSVERNRYDVLYLREPAVWFKFNRISRLCRRLGTKIVVEIPTHPIRREIKKEKNIIKRAVRLRSYYYEKHRNKCIDLYVLIGEEANGIYNGRPAVNINNGIDVSSKKLRKNKELSGPLESINMLALSVMVYWQGYDRIIEGMKSYKGDTSVYLHLVGNDADGTLEKLQKLAEQYHLENNVVVHGPLYGDALDRIFDECDVGIGTLGLYRKGMKKSSVLKIRDYMSRGLPFIHATEDSDIEKAVFGQMIVPNDDSPIDIAAVLCFAENCNNDVNCIRNMRDFAMRNLTWNLQIQKMIDAIHEL